MSFPSVLNVDHQNPAIINSLGIVMLDGFLRLNATSGNQEPMQVWLVFLCIFSFRARRLTNY